MNTRMLSGHTAVVVALDGKDLPYLRVSLTYWGTNKLIHMRLTTAVGQADKELTSSTAPKKRAGKDMLGTAVQNKVHAEQCLSLGRHYS